MSEHTNKLFCHILFLTRRDDLWLLRSRVATRRSRQRRLPLHHHSSRWSGWLGFRQPSVMRQPERATTRPLPSTDSLRQVSNSIHSIATGLAWAAESPVCIPGNYRQKSGAARSPPLSGPVLPAQYACPASTTAPLRCMHDGHSHHSQPAARAAPTGSCCTLTSTNQGQHLSITSQARPYVGQLHVRKPTHYHPRGQHPQNHQCQLTTTVSLIRSTGSDPQSPPQPHAAGAPSMIPLFSPGQGATNGLDLLAAAAAGKTDKSTTEMASLSLSEKPGPFNPTASLAPKVVRCILELDFVEMSEVTVDDMAPQALGRPPPPARLPITDISQWVERFSLMVAVLFSRFPEKAGELFAYQASIVRAEWNYEGKHWVAYDRQFRREALARRDLNWSVPGPRLYNEAFTGQARFCSYCPQDDYGVAQCPCNLNRPIFGWFPDLSLWPTQSVSVGQSAQGRHPSTRICRRLTKVGAVLPVAGICTDAAVVVVTMLGPALADFSSSYGHTDRVHNYACTFQLLGLTSTGGPGCVCINLQYNHYHL